MRRNMSKGSKHLRKIIEVQKINESMYQLIVNENELNDQIQGAGQVIADSDDFAFIYLLDAGDVYSHLRVAATHWSTLAKMLQAPEIVVTDGTTTLPLPNFKEELTALLFNIEGNDNYGTAFVEQVEAVFKDILQ